MLLQLFFFKPKVCVVGTFLLRRRRSCWGFAGEPNVRADRELFAFSVAAQQTPPRRSGVKHQPQRDSHGQKPGFPGLRGLLASAPQCQRPLLPRCAASAAFVCCCCCCFSQTPGVQAVTIQSLGRPSRAAAPGLSLRLARASLPCGVGMAGSLTGQLKAPRMNVPMNKTEADLQGLASRHVTSARPTSLPRLKGGDTDAQLAAKEHQRVWGPVLRVPSRCIFFSHFHAFAQSSHLSGNVVPRPCPLCYYPPLLHGSAACHLLRKHLPTSPEQGSGSFCLACLSTHRNCLVLLCHLSLNCGHSKKHGPCFLLPELLS